MKTKHTDILPHLEPGSRVAILRLRSLGDCVLSTPAIELLREYRPDLQLGIAVEPCFAGVYRSEEVLEPSIGAVRSFAPRLCLNFHGGSRSAKITAFSGASFRAGFDIFRPSWIYNAKLPTAQITMGLNRRVHTAEHMASAMFALGVPLGDVPRAKLPCEPGWSPLAPQCRYVVIHPLAATPEKTWDARNFLTLASHLSKNVRLEPVFIGAPGDDLKPFDAWTCIQPPSIRELSRVMAKAALFIGNDSGPAHVAAAFGVPQVVLFGPSDAEIWHPWRTRHQVLQAMPMSSIGVEEAMQAVEKVLL